MLITLLDSETLGDDLDWSILRTWGTVKLYESTGTHDRESHLKNADVAVSNRVRFDAELLDQCPDLKLILLAATGHNAVDLDACRRRGVAAANVKGYSTASVAQHTLALLLEVMERTSLRDTFVRTRWKRKPEHALTPPFREISGKTWGILGLGAIGTKVAQIAEALDATVFYASATGADRPGSWPRLEVDELLSRCDIVTIHWPLNDATRNRLGARELSLMRSSAYLVNVGRGGILDEEALAQILREGRIAGAGVDVFQNEPIDPNHPLLQPGLRSPLVVSPHCAWGSTESRERCVQEVGENLRAWVEGRRRNRLD